MLTRTELKWQNVSITSLGADMHFHERLLV